MANVNTKQVSFLMGVFGGEVGCNVEVFINNFGNFGVANGSVSVYIEHGEYHLAIGSEFFNNLNESELIEKLAQLL